MSERVRVSDLSWKERDKLRAEIVEYCVKPRTYQEVAAQFSLGGISASAVLSNLCTSQLEYVDGKYVTSVAISKI